MIFLWTMTDQEVSDICWLQICDNAVWLAGNQLHKSVSSVEHDWVEVNESNWREKLQASAELVLLLSRPLNFSNSCERKAEIAHFWGFLSLSRHIFASVNLTLFPWASLHPGLMKKKAQLCPSTKSHKQHGFFDPAGNGGKCHSTKQLLSWLCDCRRFLIMLEADLTFRSIGGCKVTSEAKQWHGQDNGLYKHSCFCWGGSSSFGACQPVTSCLPQRCPSVWEGRYRAKGSFQVSASIFCSLINLTPCLAGTRIRCMSWSYSQLYTSPLLLKLARKIWSCSSSSCYNIVYPSKCTSRTRKRRLWKMPWKYHVDISFLLSEHEHCFLMACSDGVVLVCTDAAARGLDIPDVTHVIQAEFAASAVDFIHRVSHRWWPLYFRFLTPNASPISRKGNASTTGSSKEVLWSLLWPQKLNKRGLCGILAWLVSRCKWMSGIIPRNIDKTL